MSENFTLFDFDEGGKFIRYFKQYYLVGIRIAKFKGQSGRKFVDLIVPLNMDTSMFEELNQNRVSQFLKCGIFSLVLLCAGTNAQATLQTIGAGTAVSVPADRTMTFDSLTNGTSLATYSEESMTILYDGFASSQGNTTHPGFTPFHGQNFYILVVVAMERLKYKPLMVWMLRG